MVQGLRGAVPSSRWPSGRWTSAPRAVLPLRSARRGLPGRRTGPPGMRRRVPAGPEPWLPGGGCSPRTGRSAPGPTAALAPSVAVSDHYVPLPDGGFSPAPGPSIAPPTYPTAPFISSRQDGGRWTFFPSGARNSTPDRVSLRALAADGAVLAEQENDLVWTKEDPSNPCGSQVATQPITFKVDAR